MKRAHFDPGELDHRLYLQRLVEVPDGSGALEAQYHSVQAVWARLQPTGRAERLLAQQIDERTDHTITIRFRTDVATGWRFVKGAREFEIVATTDPDERRRYLQCHTQEVAR